jgi:serine/threonine protein kinase
MTTRRNDKTAAPPPKGQDASASKKLLTSEELFGDLVDGPPAARKPGSGATPATRPGPIKVQVGEPGTAHKTSPLASAPAPGEKLPDDVAALLDAFSEPAESLIRQDAELDTLPPEAGPAAAPPEGDSLLDDLTDEEPPTITPADEDDDVVDDALLLDVLEPLPPAPAPDDGASLRDLFALGLPGGGREPDPVKPASRLAIKFTAAAPRKEAAPPAGESLDLAALAEDAFATAEAPAPAAPSLAAEPPPSARSSAIRLDEGEDAAEEAAAVVGESVAPSADASAGAPAEAAGSTPASDYGPYHLLERIAVGGMAEVFRAKRTGVEGFEKVVAVKRILSHLSDNKEFVDMFIDEAKMVGSLAHPNVAQIFDLGRQAKNYWIAMEYVHGRDLRTILRRARDRDLRIPLDISTYIVSKVCAALEYAHRKKDDKGQPMLIVHRDISPQNILISFEGDVKLTDFGIAKAASKASTTDKGALRGKLLYMSPEQAWGKPMDKRSDVFSLGIVFYEMLTEQKPFLGTSEMSILETVRECRVPPPTTINERIPEKLERVVMKALERDPDVRYQDAGEMLRDLERVLHEWQPATASGLVRFLELLFDEHERGDVPVDGEAGEAGGGPAVPALLREPTGPMPVVEASAPAKDPMSIQKLLKRFGIK